MITTDTQAHHERVLKVLSEDGETPPSWLGYILLCRCPNFSFKLIGWLIKEVKQEIFMFCLCLCCFYVVRRATRDFSYHMSKMLEYKAGRDTAQAEILAGKPTLLFL